MQRSLPMPELSRRESSGILYLTDDALFDACGVRIAFTGRHGGVSSPPFSTLNLGTHVGDDPSCVTENRRRACQALGVDAAWPIVSLNQVHGTEVIVVDDGSEEALARIGELADEGADAVVVEAPDVAAMLCFADCLPLVLVIPTGAFAVVHAGWRGAMDEIASKAVDMLLKGAPGVQPSAVNAYIGPHIRWECFEVSEDLALRFRGRFGDEVTTDARHVSLSAVVRATLESRGVLRDRIVDAGVCTACQADDFFSYRAEAGRCGRHGAIAFRRSVSEG